MKGKQEWLSLYISRWGQHSSQVSSSQNKPMASSQWEERLLFLSSTFAVPHQLWGGHHKNRHGSCDPIGAFGVYPSPVFVSCLSWPRIKSDCCLLLGSSAGREDWWKNKGRRKSDRSLSLTLSWSNRIRKDVVLPRLCELPPAEATESARVILFTGMSVKKYFDFSRSQEAFESNYVRALKLEHQQGGCAIKVSSN